MLLLRFTLHYGTATHILRHATKVRIFFVTAQREVLYFV